MGPFVTAEEESSKSSAEVLNKKLPLPFALLFVHWGQLFTLKLHIPKINTLYYKQTAFT
jgi:hypothetical protein